MENLLLIVEIIYARRFVASAALAIGLSLALAWTFPSMTKAVPALISLTGIAFGLLWEGRHMSGVGLFAKVSDLPEPAISTPVAALCLPLFGLIVAAGIGGLFDSPTAGMCVNFVLILFYVLWRSLQRKRALPMSRIAFTCFFMAILPAIIVSLAVDNMSFGGQILDAGDQPACAVSACRHCPL